MKNKLSARFIVSNTIIRPSIMNQDQEIAQLKATITALTNTVAVLTTRITTLENRYNGHQHLYDEEHRINRYTGKNNK